MKSGPTLRVLALLLIGLSFPRLAKALEDEWVRNDPKNRGVIIFVHGVTGSGKGTWTSKAGDYWPEMLAHDHHFDGQNIYVFHYDSPPNSGALTIDQLADEMRLVLSTDGVLRADELTFVSHSMGGIVTRAFILRYRKEIASKIRFLYFFATPTTGSDSEYAKLAKLSQNPQFGELLPIKQTGDRYLPSLVEDWSKAEFPFPSYCAYETKPLYGELFVSMQSATFLCPNHFIAMNENHVTIVKPTGRKSDSYRAFQDAFDETKSDPHSTTENVQVAAKPATTKPKPKTPQKESLADRTIKLSEEIDRWQNGQAIYAPHSPAEREKFLKEIAEYHRIFDPKVKVALAELEACEVDTAKIKSESAYITDSALHLMATFGVAMALKEAANNIPEGQPKCGTGEPTKGFGIKENGQYWLEVGLSSQGPYKTDLQRGRKSAPGFKLGDYSSSVSLYLQAGELCVDATIFRSPGIPLLNVLCDKVDAPPGWDKNFAEKAVEVVNENEVPMFQIIIEDDRHVRVNAVIPTGPNRYSVYTRQGVTTFTIDPAKPNTQVIPIDRLFKYPGWQHRGEYAK